MLRHLQLHSALFSSPPISSLKRSISSLPPTLSCQRPLSPARLCPRRRRRASDPLPSHSLLISSHRPLRRSVPEGDGATAVGRRRRRRRRKSGITEAASATVTVRIGNAVGRATGGRRRSGEGSRAGTPKSVLSSTENHDASTTRVIKAATASSSNKRPSPTLAATTTSLLQQKQQHTLPAEEADEAMSSSRTNAVSPISFVTCNSSLRSNDSNGSNKESNRERNQRSSSRSSKSPKGPPPLHHPAKTNAPPSNVVIADARSVARSSTRTMTKMTTMVVGMLNSYHHRLLLLLRPRRSLTSKFLHTIPFTEAASKIKVAEALASNRENRKSKHSRHVKARSRSRYRHCPIMKDRHRQSKENRARAIP